MYRFIWFLVLFEYTNQYEFRKTRLGQNHGSSSEFTSSNNFGSSNGLESSNNIDSSNFANSDNCRRKSGWPFHRTGGPNRSSLEKIACDIAKGLIEVDRKIQGYCQAHAEHYMRESYGVEYYKLILAVNDFNEDSISVKVLHKMIYVSAENCDSTFADIRILPDVVNPSSGKWAYDEGELTVYFRYIMKPETQILKFCGPTISTNVFVVPKADNNDNLEQDYAVKFGDDSFRDSVKTFYHHKEDNKYIVNVKF